ncbi:MAG: tRNA guanosine(34) transglycosylase Tgt [Gemmatimonadaceae bacterium]
MILTPNRKVTRLPIVMPEFSFQTSHEQGSARLGWFRTPHGVVETPAFMPVGTHGVVRGLSMDEVAAAGAEMVLSNAYHLYLRPGDMVVRALGGLHAFTRWDGPMLTDSGGFQVFSLARLRTVNEDGVEFRSHIDGSSHRYTPETVMRIERNIGADVVMQLDELIPGQSDETAARSAMERSLRWLRRCRTEFDRISTEGREPMVDMVPPPGAPALSCDVTAPAQALFPIVQGGTHTHLRAASIAGILDSGDWCGVAIGGLSVGESKHDTYATIETCDPLLPRTVPRYLMGVGFPDDLIEGVRRGIDLFDCVAPTRMGRDGTAFTPDGKLQIRQASNRLDRRPVVEGCCCPCCTTYDRAYVRHLFASDEMLGKRLLALHNVSFLINLMRDARVALRSATFDSWSDEWLRRYAAHARVNPK